MDTDQVLSGAKILCVDDSSDTLELLRIVLNRHGAIVSICTSAESAIERLKRENFDILISDLSMPPGLDGYDLVHTLREMESKDPERSLTPTIALSSDAMKPSRKRRYADFQVYMVKPVNKVRLVYIVERLLEADNEAVKSGSLGLWEAKEAIQAATVATTVASTATAAAAEATETAKSATTAAADATEAAHLAQITAADAEKKAQSAAARTPKSF